jgi:RNA polymerase sigma factor, sigma-70 family
VSKFENINSPQLLAGLQSGSQDSFNYLAKEMFTPLWRFLVATSGVPERDAEEIAQDTMMKVYENIRTFKRTGKAQLTTWIFQIARNLAIDFHRIHKDDKERKDAIGREFYSPVWGSFAGRNAADAKKLTDALEMFSADDQNILFWRIQDFSYADISKWLQIKENTARVRHLRAMNRLRTTLEAEEALENEDKPTNPEQEVVCTTSN